jgi:hypothetical protein
MSARTIVSLVSALSVCLGVGAPVRAQLGPGEAENLVLPDAFYVSQRCGEPEKTLNRVRRIPALLAKVDIKAAEALAGEMAGLCGKSLEKQISGDDWLQRFEPKSKALEDLTDACGRIVHCMKFFLPPAKPLPADFKAYALFLFPSAEWDRPERAVGDDLGKIREAFSAFGDSIGAKRAAIWFSKSAFSANPDIARSKYFADLFKLNYNDGPFIVTSLKRPDALVAGDDLVVIKLSSISAGRVVKVLNILEQDLRTETAVRKHALIFEEIKQRLLSVVDRNPDIGKELVKGAIGLITK